MSDNFTDKQRLFIDVFSGNAAKAARQAGYKSSSASAAGSANLRNPKIVRAIQNREKREERLSPNELILIADRLARQAFWTGIMLDEEQPLNMRLRASELLGKSEGDFLEKTGNPGQLEPLDCEIMALTAMEEIKQIQARPIGEDQSDCPDIA